MLTDLSARPVYFELNNWFSDRDYPEDEPFISWLGNDLKQQFQDDTWVRDNKLCVVACFIDMSCNYCITASYDWVMRMCPKLMTEYCKFLRYPNDDGIVYGRFDHEFLEYKPENYGVTWVDDYYLSS